MTATTRPPCRLCQGLIRTMLGTITVLNAPKAITVHSTCYDRLVDSRHGSERRAEKHIRALALAPSSGPLGCETCGAPPNSDHPEACYP